MLAVLEEDVSPTLAADRSGAKGGSLEDSVTYSL